MYRLKFNKFPLMDADDGLNVGGASEETQEVAEPVVEEGEEEQEAAEVHKTCPKCGKTIDGRT